METIRLRHASFDSLDPIGSARSPTPAGHPALARGPWLRPGAVRDAEGQGVRFEVLLRLPQLRDVVATHFLPRPSYASQTHSQNACLRQLPISAPSMLVSKTAAVVSIRSRLLPASVQPKATASGNWVGGKRKLLRVANGLVVNDRREQAGFAIHKTA